MGIRSFSEDNSPFQVNQKYISQKLIEEIKDSSNLLSDKNYLKKMVICFLEIIFQLSL